MSKGWYVKVDIPVHFNIDCNVGVVASCEREAEQVAKEIVTKDLVADFPWDFEVGAFSFTRGCETFSWDDRDISCIVEPDSDFDPDPDPDRAEELMEAAQCLNEAYHDLPDDHPLQLYRDTHGICVVRSCINDLAGYATDLHRLMVDEQGYDNCFDWDFIPTFLERCVEDDFTVRSKDLHILSMYWGLE